MDRVTRRRRIVRSVRRALGVGACAAVVAVQLAGGARAQEDVDVVRCEGDRLTLDVASMPLRTLLLEVGRQSGAQVRIEGLDERTVSEAFTRLPLDEALRRLLGDSNFTLVYAGAPETGDKPSSLRLKELRVYGGEGPVVSSTAARRPTPSPRPTAAGPATAPHGAAPTRPGQRPTPAGPAAARQPGAPNQPQPQAPDADAVPQDQDAAAAEIPPGAAQPAVVDIGQAAVGAAAEGDPSAVGAPPPALSNPVSAAVLGDAFGGEGVWEAGVDPEAMHEGNELIYNGPVYNGTLGDGGGVPDAPE